MSTPPPFGDPANIRRENSSAVGKGIAFGCGGCAALVVLLIVLGAGIFLVAMSFIRNTDPFRDTLKAATASAVVKQEMGEPISLGWFFSGSIKKTNGSGTARLTIPLTGPAGSAQVRVEGTVKPGEPWHYTRMTATLQPSGRQVDLLPSLLPGEPSSPP